MVKKSQSTTENSVDSGASEKIITVEDLLKAHKIDLNEWKVIKSTINSWDVQKKMDDNSIKITPMYQTKVLLEKNYVKNQYDSMRKEFVDYLKTISPKKLESPKKIIKEEDDHLMEINIFDFHFGKMSWHEETGFNSLAIFVS